MSAWLILAACIAAGLLNEVSASILNLAMPDTARDLGASSSAAQFILLAGKLSLGALMLAGGGAGDRFGRKRTMIAGIGLVALAAILSAVAQSAGMLAGARILDGIGNALVGPLALALAIASFPDSMRARIIGLFLGVSGLGVAIGPLIAGFLVELGGWRIGFAAPLALALAAGVAIALLTRPEPPDLKRPPSDYPGVVLCVLGLVTLVLGFVLAGRHGWGAATTLGLLTVGILSLAVFAWWETARAASPLLDPALLRSRRVLVALAASLLASMVLNGTVLPLLYFLQRIHGYGPVASVLRLLPLVVAAMVVAPVAGGLADRHGRRLVMVAGLGAMTAGSGAMATLTPATGFPLIAFALVLIGAGVMAVMTPAADLVLATSGPQRSGSAAALNGAIMQVGGAVGIGVITSIFLTRALQSFAADLSGRGYTRDQIIGPVQTLREIVRQTTLRSVPQVPEIPPEMQRDILEAYARAFADGVGHAFLAAVALSVAAVVIVVVGMGRGVDKVPPGP